MMRMLKNLFKAAAFCVCLFLLLSAAGSVLRQSLRFCRKGKGQAFVCRLSDYQFIAGFMDTAAALRMEERKR